MANVLVRILVVDDFEAWRRQVCAILQTRPDFSVVAEAEDGVEAVRKAAALQPNVVLLDIGLPKLNGIEAANQILLLVPSPNILFVSQNSNADVVAAALSDGAKGYIHKQSARTELLPAVDAVLRGDCFVSKSLDLSVQAPSTL